MSLIFIDSDILFSFFAINQEKIKNFKENQTTGDQELDTILNLIEEIEKKKQIICISEFSILELVCTLKRRKSTKKIPQLITKIYNICDVLPLNDHIIKLAWYLGSNFKLHSGDAIHISFCLFYDLDYLFLKEKEFFESLSNIQKDYNANGSRGLINFFNLIEFAKHTPKTIIDKYNNLNKLKIKKI